MTTSDTTHDLPDPEGSAPTPAADQIEQAALDPSVRSSFVPPADPERGIPADLTVRRETPADQTVIKQPSEEPGGPPVTLYPSYQQTETVTSKLPPDESETPPA